MVHGPRSYQQGRSTTTAQRQPFAPADPPSQFCGAICHDGLYNVPTSIIQGDILDFDPSFGGRAYIWSNQAGLERFNPASPARLQNWKNAPPTLVIHSEKDYRCPITEGLATFKTLQAQGVPSRFLTFPDEGHWVMGAENALFWYDAVLEWMDRCTKGEVKRGDKEW